MKIIRYINKIIKIFKYIPIIWKDEDWDYGYLLDLMSFKLKRMKATFQEEDILTAQDLSKLIDGIDTILLHIDNFLDPTYEKFEALYGQSPVQIVPHKDLTEKEQELLSNYLKLHYEFEQNEWNAIWDTIKAKGRTFWS